MDVFKEKEILGIEIDRKNSSKALFEISDAIWLHKGTQPHALLASGKHSDGYVNCNQVLRFPNLNRILVEQLIKKLAENGIIKDDVDWVVSSAYAAIPFGQEVAKQLNACFGFTEKNDKNQIWKRFEIPKGAIVLQAEELITTLSTSEKVREAIYQDNPHQSFEFLKKDGKVVVATLVHRPNSLPVDYLDYVVMPLIELEIHAWDEKDCSLCKAGSPALKPKSNWQKLKINYKK